MLNRRDVIRLPLAQLAPAQYHPPVYQWQGTPREIGKQHGMALPAKIRLEFQAALTQYARASGQSERSAAKQYWQRFRNEFAQRAPTALDEIEGIAEGSDLPLEIAFFAATRDLLPNPDGCTAVVCGAGRSSRGMPIIGQTKDSNARLERYLVGLLRYDSGLRAITLGYAGWIGNMSLNSFGLAWTGNSLYAPEPKGNVHPGSLLKRIFLESSTVSEILVRSKGLVLGNACFLIADRTGRAICMEWVNGQCELVEIGDRLFGHANDILGSLRAVDQSANHLPGSTQRQRRIDELLRDAPKQVSTRDFENWLRDHHNSPYSICSHPSSPERLTTTAAYIADLSSLEFRVVVGQPCQQSFRSFRMEDV